MTARTKAGHDPVKKQVATTAYLRRHDLVPVKTYMNADGREALRRAADRQGQSGNEFMIDALNDRLEHLGFGRPARGHRPRS